MHHSSLVRTPDLVLSRVQPYNETLIYVYVYMYLYISCTFCDISLHGSNA